MRDIKIILGVIIVITLGTAAIATTPFLQSVQGQSGSEEANKNKQRESDIAANKAIRNAQQDAPMASSGDNIYIVWWSNKTGNSEVIFRASDDNGQTLGDKINLSNTTDAESDNAQILAAGDNVFVTWWERSETANEPVLRVSTDNGKTFGETIALSTNGTIE